MKITITMSDLAIAKELYERLERLRKAKGLSQDALVENLGISRPTYARLKRGTCSLGTFIGVLRELNLLEGLEALVPTPTVRPSEIIKAKTGRKRNHRQPVLTTSGRNMEYRSVKDMLANRKKNKVTE